MTDETIVAVYDTAEHAERAIRDLEAAGVPTSAITQHAEHPATAGAVGAAPQREQGFWSSLFGGEPEYGHDTAVYDRSLAGGSTVVTVRAPEQYLVHTMEILERHNPVDIDERAAGYGSSAATAGVGGDRLASGVTAPVGEAPASAGRVDADAAAGRATGDETLSLSEEQIAVGKRAINRGTTKVRRYVVETPVTENVALRDETVSIERRPVSDQRPVTGADFSDRVIEVTETAEEAVVSKTARVREEVVIHKDATERTETVHDTVRREDVEITKDGAVVSATGTPRR